MPRKRTELTSEQNAELEVRTQRGESAKTVFAALGGVLSVATIDRRQRELRAGAAPKHVAPAPAAPGAPVAGTVNPVEPLAPGRPSISDDVSPDVPDEIPGNASLDMLDRWIARVEKGAQAAEAAGNLPALSSLAMRAASLAQARLKALPIPKPDPNENPDFVALAKQGEELLLKKVRALFEPSE